MKTGWNLGNTLDATGGGKGLASEVSWGQPYTTKEMIDAKVQEIESERRRDSEKIYYPSELKKANSNDKAEKLFISSIAQDIKDAIVGIKAGTDYWTAWDADAERLATKASGGAIGPECTQGGRVAGYYYHYHLLGRVGGHSFYGTPVGGTY